MKPLSKMIYNLCDFKQQQQQIISIKLSYNCVYILGSDSDTLLLKLLMFVSNISTFF